MKRAASGSILLLPQAIWAAYVFYILIQQKYENEALYSIACQYFSPVYQIKSSTSKNLSQTSRYKFKYNELSDVSGKNQ